MRINAFVDHTTSSAAAADLSFFFSFATPPLHPQLHYRREQSLTRMLVRETGWPGPHVSDRSRRFHRNRSTEDQDQEAGAPPLSQMGISCGISGLHRAVLLTLPPGVRGRVNLTGGNRSGSGSGRYPTGQNSNFKFEFKK